MAFERQFDREHSSRITVAKVACQQWILAPGPSGDLNKQLHIESRQTQPQKQQSDDDKNTGYATLDSERKEHEICGRRW
jgi:hypothetical protein